MVQRIAPITRRGALAGALAAAASGAALVSACSENPVTGRNQFVIIGDDQLAQLGEAAWADLQRQVPRTENAAAQARLEAIGAAVAERSGLTNLNWEFIAFASPDVNAFVLPGGKVGFFEGLLDLAADDAEIAAVMGHEVGHVQARHAAERMSQQLAVQIGVMAATVLLAQEYGEHAADIAGVLGMGALYGVVMPYSRSHEFEADALGVGLMAQAGYAPTAAVSFWERMTQGDRPEPPALLSTHPASADRLARLREAVAQLG